jgi:hypothetical protein
MSKQRGPLLLLIICAVLAVSGGYASSIPKPAIQQASAFYGATALQMPLTIDYWLGGSGNWSDPAYWSGGVPGTDSDVVIDSGGTDDVSLYTSASIASLILGGTTGSSALEVDGGSLTIAGALTVNPTGTLDGVVTVGGNAFNSGTIVGTLTVGGNAFNSGTTYGPLTVDRDAFNSGTINGTVTVGGNAFNSGTINGGMSVNGTLTNSAGIDADHALIVAFNVVNSGSISVFSGSLIASSIVNSGSIGLYQGGALEVSGDLYNSGAIQVASGSPNLYFLQVGGTLTNTMGA